MSKVNPAKQSGLVNMANYFFLKGSENIGLFNPTNSQAAMFVLRVFASVPSILRYRIFQLSR